MYVTAIIAAGGRGQRFGGEVPKQLLTVAGRSLLERSVSAFATHLAIDEVVVALPAEIASDPPPYLKTTSKPLRIVVGGDRRQQSVANAFRAIADRAELVVVHDAARPFVSASLIERTIGAAAESGAAIAALAARDTVKQAERGMVRGTLPRDTVFLAQTPQAFRRSVLRDALGVDADATDEAMLAERAGHAVRIVEGEATNIKITTVDDLWLAEAIARSVPGSEAPISGTDERGVTGHTLPARTGRAGTGYDLHRLVAGRALMIGGVAIPAERGALGHSDADVLCHAITDAILGAAGIGDIGRHFPDSDSRWKDASSLDMLARASALVRQQGFEVGNVDATVILEAPKIRDHVDAMRKAVARALGIDPARVSVKGKTNEGVDAIGRGEAIAAHAIALIRSTGR